MGKNAVATKRARLETPRAQEVSAHNASAPEVGAQGVDAEPKPGPMGVRLTPQHVWVGYGVALMAAASMAVLWLPNLGHPVARGATGGIYLLIGLVLSAVMALTVASKRRILVAGGALLLAVAPWGPEYFLQIGVFALAVWHLIGVGRVTRAQMRGLPEPPPLRERFTWLSAMTARRGDRALAVTGPRGVTASKRYTPPAR